MRAGRAIFRLALVALTICVACGGGQSSEGAESPGQPSPRGTPAEETPSPAEPDVLAEIETGNGPTAMLDAFDSLWVVNHAEGSVSRIDPSSNEVVSTIRLEGYPPELVGGYLTEGFGSVWVAFGVGDRLQRIDPTTEEVSDLRLRRADTSGTIAPFGDEVWIIHHEGDATLARIDPTTNEVTVFPLGVGSHLVDIVPAFGSLWVTDGNEAAVYRVDRNGRVVATVALEAGVAPNLPAVGPDSRWVGTLQGIVRIDPASNEVLATVPLPDSGLPWALAYGDGSLQVSSAGARLLPQSRGPPYTLHRLDPGSESFVETFSLPPSTYGNELEVAFGSLWAANFDTGKVLRLDVQGGQDAIVPGDPATATITNREAPLRGPRLA